MHILRAEKKSDGTQLVDHAEILAIIPAWNESGAIGQTIADIKRLALSCSIVVCDNNSTDNKALEAERAGALVLHEQVKGKGNAVRRLLRDVDSEIYVMVDGDNTDALQPRHDDRSFS